MILAALVAVALQADSFPTKPPAPTVLAPVRFPPFQQTVLPNGIALVVVENHEQPEVSVSLNFRAGDYLDPAGKEGLASIVADLLTKGTATRTADQIAATIEGVGGSLSAGAGSDFFSIDASVLTDYDTLAFGLMGDVALHSTFPESEVDLSRTRALSSLQVSLSQPGNVADRFYAAELYGRNPYGRDVTEASLKAITRADVVTFAAERLRPSGALLVVAGDINLAQARGLAEKAFGAWRGTPPPVAADVTTPVKTKTDILLVNRPGSAQANIVLGNLTMRPGDSLYYAARVASQILGGGVDSRLFLILREQKSWTYGSYAGLTRVKGMGYWEATFEGRTDVADSALREMLHQVDRMRTETVADSELANTRGFLVGVFPLTIETPSQIADQVATQKLLGLPADYLRLYRERLAAVTAAQVRAAAQRFYKRGALTIVVVGDAEKLFDKLSAIAPVRMVDPDGKPLTLADLHPKADRPVLDPAQLVARADSYTFNVNGNAQGFQVTHAVVTKDSVYTTSTLDVGGGAVHRDTRVQYNPSDWTVAQVDDSRAQQTAAGPQKGAVHLTYAAGHVRGQITTDPPAASPPPPIDAVVDAGTYDEAAMHFILPALPLTVGKTLNLNVFSAQEGSASVMQVKVAGTDTVTVPAGTFTTYRIELAGAQAPVVMYVSTTTPRRIVKIAFTGQPITLELVK